MAAQENLRGHRPEEEGEPHLPNSELDQLAAQYLKRFLPIVESTPEFQQALATNNKVAKDSRYGYVEVTSTGISDKPMPVVFEKGDHTYEVYYMKFSGNAQELEVSKHRTHHKKHDRWYYEAEYETVELSVTALNYPREDRGFIRHAEYTVDGEHHFFANTPTAVRKVEDFFTTNFGEPQAQPSTGK